MNNTFFINTPVSTSSTSEVLPTRTFKGETTIAINFSNLQIPVINPPPLGGQIKLIKIQIDFGDGISVEKIYSNKVNLLETIEHTYFPSDISYIASRRCTVNLIFSNFNIHSVVIPLNIAQSSFLSEYGVMTVKRAQFIDSAALGDMFLVLESDKHNLYNVGLKVGKISSLQPTITTEDNLLISQAEEFFNTNFNEKIKAKPQ